MKEVVAAWKLLHLLPVNEVNKAQVAAGKAEVTVNRPVGHCLEAAAGEFLRCQAPHYEEDPELVKCLDRVQSLASFLHQVLTSALLYLLVDLNGPAMRP